MTRTHAALVAEQFDDREQQHEAASFGVWIFLATEVMFFGGLFASYTIYRNAFYRAFAEGSHHLAVQFGATNTAVLILSSLTMALAVHAAQEGNNRLLFIFLLITIFFACCFLGIKAIEYHTDLREQLWPGQHFKPGLPPR